MRTVRGFSLALLAAALACQADTAPTAPARPLAGLSSVIADGPVVHLVALSPEASSRLLPQTRMVVTSYDAFPTPSVMGGITFVGVAEVVAPDRDFTGYSLVTDTALDRGTMLIAQQQPPPWPSSFEAILVLHGSSN
jgi:hypothetical protein